MFPFRKSTHQFILGLLLCLAASGSGLGIAQAGNLTRVLFVGNSYTYYNSMPQIFEAMVENCNHEQQVETKFIGGGGATLEKHWDIGIALQEIKSGQWDFVVLQEQSTLGSKNLEDSGTWGQFYKYARKFDQEITNSGAKTVFFMTWSRRNVPQQQKFLTTAYINIARELDSILAPVGLAWDVVRKNDNLALYEDDGSHPSVQGSYLAAMTLFAAIFGTEPQGLSGTLEGFEILRGGVLAEEKSLLCDLPPEYVKVIEDGIKSITGTPIQSP